jgi:tetratricopeptide (TPR) repeat protein
MPSCYAENEYAIELANVGRMAESLVHFERALAINPRWARAHASYAYALYLTDDTRGAIAHFERAFALEPSPPARTEWHVFYAHALVDDGRPDEAIRHYEAQLHLDPDDRAALFGLAELRATWPAEPVRNGGEAFLLAQRACRLQRCTSSGELDVLALAVAAAGDPATAVKVETEALRASNLERSAGMVDRVTRHLQLFQSGQAVVGPAS